MITLANLPGADLVARGLDIPASTVSESERALYETLQREHGDATHSRYNALIFRDPSARFARSG